LHDITSGVQFDRLASERHRPRAKRQRSCPQPASSIRSGPLPGQRLAKPFVDLRSSRPTL